MKTGKVVGPILATKRLWEAPSGALLIVELDPPLKQGKQAHDEPAKERLIAFDVLGCGKDESVLVAMGSVAAAWFSGKSPPIDALIIASLMK